MLKHEPSEDKQNWRALSWLRRHPAPMQDAEHGDAGQKSVQQWCKALDHHVPATRAEAIEQLVKSGASAIPGLLQILEDGSIKERSAAIEVLSRINNPCTIPALCKVLDDRFYLVREQAATALSQIGKPAIEPLCHIFDTGDSNARRSAISALSRIGSLDIKPHMMHALHDEDTVIKSLAVSALVKVGLPVVNDLCRALKDESVGESVQQALEQIGSPAVDKLCVVLRSGYYRARARAAASLGKIGDARAVMPLCVALTDSYFQVRGQAAIALGKIGDMRAVEPLCNALEDTEVSLYASAALVAIGSPAVHALCAVLKQHSRHGRQQAAAALCRIGDARAVEPLCELLCEKNIEAMELCQLIEALGELQDSRAVEPLCKLLTDRSSYVRLAAITALGKIGSSQATTALCHMLEDEEASVRQQTAETLGRMGHREALPALRARLFSVHGEHYISVDRAIRAAIKRIEKATAATRGLPRSSPMEILETIGRPRSSETEPTPEGRPRMADS